MKQSKNNGKAAVAIVAILNGGCAVSVYCPPRPCIPTCEPNSVYKGTFEADQSTVAFEVSDKSCPDSPYKFTVYTPAGVALIEGNSREANVRVAEAENFNGGHVQFDEGFNCRNYGNGIECSTIFGDRKNEQNVSRLVTKLVGEFLPKVRSESSKFKPYQDNL